MKTPPRRNPPPAPRRSAVHGPDQRSARPGLVVVNVAAADDATALAFQQLLGDGWATAAAVRTTRDVDQPGVRLRCYLDLRRPVNKCAVSRRQ
ncbi:DUF6207 family protein [Streptomyces sp. NPDC005209]|uniref:DUF6207 family protein n=1 Tax=Streptomyces sp. NPDC005209 TaxID=3156715 RepID=UPI0033A24184